MLSGASGKLIAISAGVARWDARSCVEASRWPCACALSDEEVQGLAHTVDGLGAPEIAAKMGLCGATVRFWLKRFNARGLAGLEEDVRSHTAPPEGSIIVRLDELGPLASKSSPGRHGNGCVFGDFRPAAGAALTAPRNGRITANWVDFLGQAGGWGLDRPRLAAGPCRGGQPRHAQRDRRALGRPRPSALGVRVPAQVCSLAEPD